MGEPERIDARAGAGDDDQPVMYLVSDHPADHEQAELVRACLRAADRAREADGVAPGALASWLDGLHRVVVLHARGSQLERIADLPGACGERAGPAHRVIGLGPRARADAAGPLRRARLLSVRHARPALGSDHPERLALSVAEAVDLSLGKLIVQCAHAVTLHARADPGAHRRWARAGRPIALAWSGPDRFAAACARAGALVVRDAGLTELIPGTATVTLAGPGMRHA